MSEYISLLPAQQAYEQTRTVYDEIDISKELELIKIGIGEQITRGYFHFAFGPMSDALLVEAISIHMEELGYSCSAYIMGVKQFGLNIGWKYMPANTRERLN